MREKIQFDQEQEEIKNTANIVSFASSDGVKDPKIVPFAQIPFPAYQGKEFNEEEIQDILSEWVSWMSVKKVETYEEIVASAVEKLAGGEVIAWFQGKSGMLY